MRVQQTKGRERPGNTFPITQFPEDYQGFFRQGACRHNIALHPGNDTQQVEREGHAWLVSQFPEQGQTLLAVGFDPIIIILDGGERPGSKVGLCPRARRYYDALAC